MWNRYEQTIYQKKDINMTFKHKKDIKLTRKYRNAN